MHALIPTPHGRRGCALLYLQQQRGVLDFDECVDVLETGLHERDLGLDGVVAEGDRLAHDLLAARHEVRRQQLYKLVLDVLDEVQLRRPVTTHNEHGEETVRLLNTRIHHLNQDVRVVVELYHQLLGFLHSSETIFIY